MGAQADVNVAVRGPLSAPAVDPGPAERHLGWSYRIGSLWPGRSDRIFLELMRSRFAISGLPLLKRFRRGRPDRGRCSSR